MSRACDFSGLMGRRIEVIPNEWDSAERRWRPTGPVVGEVVGVEAHDDGTDVWIEDAAGRYRVGPLDKTHRVPHGRPAPTPVPGGGEVGP